MNCQIFLRHYCTYGPQEFKHCTRHTSEVNLAANINDEIMVVAWS